MGATGDGSKGTRRRRINATIVGDFTRLWDLEKARGGSDGQVLMRLIDQAASRSAQQTRVGVIELLAAIKGVLAEQKLATRDPSFREKIISAEAAADRIRTMMGQMQ